MVKLIFWIMSSIFLFLTLSKIYTQDSLQYLNIWEWQSLINIYDNSYH